jgi:hypothetical protein
LRLVDMVRLAIKRISLCSNERARKCIPAGSGFVDSNKTRLDVGVVLKTKYQHPGLEHRSFRGSKEVSVRCKLFCQRQRQSQDAPALSGVIRSR